MRPIKCILAICLLLECGNASMQSGDAAPTVGSIRGMVLDDKRKAASGAKVFDLPMGSPMNGKEHYAVTNSQGAFELNSVSIGKVMVVATKEGYPDGRLAVFAGDDEPPVVDVRQGMVTSGVVVELGPKGATIAGKVLDDSTHKTVRTARVLLSREDHTDWFEETTVSVEGAFELVVPQKPMKLTVTAPGYALWTYESTDKSAKSGTILLRPEARLDLVIFLRKINQD